MKFDINFNVIARCKRYDLDNKDNSCIEDIELRFDKDKSEKILFRFSDAAFILDNYKVIFKYGASHELQGLTLFTSEYCYIVMNLNQVFNDVLEGYMRIVSMNKVNQVLEFDFEAGIEIQNNTDVEDEF